MSGFKLLGALEPITLGHLRDWLARLYDSRSLEWFNSVMLMIFVMRGL
jgi:hypothetical protein